VDVELVAKSSSMIASISSRSGRARWRSDWSVPSDHLVDLAAHVKLAYAVSDC